MNVQVIRVRKPIATGSDCVVHPAVQDKPARAKLVFNALQREGPSTQQELVAATYLTARTVRDALADLDEAGVLRTQNHAADARQDLYFVTD